MYCNQIKKASIIVSANADDITRYAAGELCGYLKKLFDIEADLDEMEYVAADRPANRAGILFYLGSLEENSYYMKNSVSEPLMSAGDQTVIIRRISETEMIISGGSSKAVLWAVYGLAEKWGVEFLLHMDVLPEKREFYLPEIDILEEPLEKVRTWAFPHGLAFGPESWGIEDYKNIIDQLAKLRFNRIYLQFYPEFPLMDMEMGGTRRSTTSLFFNCHYPITDDMVGRALFDDRCEFWNRDLPVTTDCKMMLSAGKRLIQGVIAYAHARGMGVAMGVLPLEYLKEFAPAIKDPKFIKLINTETVVPGPQVRLEDEVLYQMAYTMLQTLIENYPDIDIIAPVMPEFRDWVEYSESAWNELNKKYNIEQIQTYEEVLKRAAQRTEYPGGGERAVNEVKGDIVTLYFCDLLFCERKALQHTRRPDIKIMYMYLAEELYPIITRILPVGAEVTCYVDYTPTRVLKRREALGQINPETTYTICYTLHDDNIGFLPMVAAENLGELLTTVRKAGWKGFISRYWLTSDHDICVNFLAGTMWDRDRRCFDTYTRMLTAICGEECVYEMRGMYRELENATVILERDGLGFAFPIPGMVSYHWTKKEPSEGMAEVRLDYERALDWTKRARLKAMEKGLWFIDYWINRISFGIGYLRMTEELFEGGKAERSGDITGAKEHLKCALVNAVDACTSFAKAARDRSDVASIAIFNEYGIRYIKKKIMELEPKA